MRIKCLAPGPGGGGGALPLLTVVGTRRWTGYDFPVITIDTGYLNRPNWLLAGYSVYHRVASQPTMFMTGPRSRHQRRCVRDATDFFMNVWWYTAEYAVKAQTSLAPLSRFRGSHVTTAHAHQCCRFQSYAKTVPSRMKLTTKLTKGEPTFLGSMTMDHVITAYNVWL